MFWSLAIIGFFVHVNAQSDPWAAIAVAGAAAGALWFVVVQARRREERRAEAKREGSDRRYRSG